MTTATDDNVGLDHGLPVTTRPRSLGPGPQGLGAGLQGLGA